MSHSKKSGFGRGILSLGLVGKVEDDEEEDEPLPMSIPVGLAANSSNNSTASSLNFNAGKNSTTASQKQSAASLFAINLDEMEDEEEDMPIMPLTNVYQEMEVPISQDFIDAQRSVEENKYDTQAWRVFMDEVHKKKAGAMSVPDAYNKFLEVFPRSARHWKALVNHYLSNDDIIEAAKVLQRANLHKCRSVDLWMIHLDLSKRGGLDKKKIEEIFEDCLKNVGSAIDAGPLWRKYLDYVSEIRDPTRVVSLRRIYQRALVTPMDGLDLIWNEYDKLERSAAEHLADQILPEFSDKLARTKAVCKERKRLVSNCDADRLALPPTATGAELLQLEAWNKLLKHELKNKDVVDLEQQAQFLLLLFDQSICCFRFHTEAWLALAQYLWSLGDAAASRTIFREAMEVLPRSELLRIAFAELEEQQGNVDAARELLKTGFSAIPSSVMFAALHKFLRRNDGISAARRAFSEYIVLMKKLDATPNTEICITHAMLELEVNNEPQTALRVLEYSKTLNASIASSVSFVRAMCRVLLRLGDHQQLRWLFHTTLDTAVVEGAESSFTLKETAELWEEFFRVEALLGLSSLSRMTELRVQRIRALAEYEDSLRAAPLHSRGVEVTKDLTQGVLTILERFECLDLPMGALDGGIRFRCLKLADAFTTRRVEKDDAAVETGKKKSRKEEILAADSLQHVSFAVKDLVQKLPPQPLGGVDVGAFLDQLRKVVLPTRPVDEDASKELDMIPLTGSHKRARADDGDEDLDVDLVFEDVFSKRQKLTMGR